MLWPVFCCWLLTFHILSSPPESLVGLNWNLMGGIGLHGGSELLNLLHSDIKYGCHGGHYEILHTTSSPEP